MTLAALAASAQVLAEGLMSDACTITRASEDPEDDTPTTVYSGKCRVRTRARAHSDVAGDAGTRTEQDRIEVHIPVSVEGVEFNDRIKITSSINPTLGDDAYYVAGLFAQSGASAQRLTCERRLR
jgi:hypothetical protein